MTKGDKILIVLIVVISISSLVLIANSSFGNEDKYVSVQVNGEEIKRIVFNNSTIGNTYPIETEFGYNLIEMGEDQVRVIEADCPDELDVKQGYISKPGEIIVCLPNRLVIEIKGDTADELDYITY